MPADRRHSCMISITVQPLSLLQILFDPAIGKSNHPITAFFFDWSGHKNDAVRTSEATTKNSAALRIFTLVNKLFRYSRAIFKEILEAFALQKCIREREEDYHHVVEEELKSP